LTSRAEADATEAAGAGPGGSTAAVAAFICGTASASVPPPARDAARRAILDTIGVALAATAEPSVRLVREVAAGEYEAAGGGSRSKSPRVTGPAAVWGTGDRVAALDAALVNGTAAHALDYDDTHASVRGHPSAPIVPAALAAAELAGATGRQLADAYLIGLEVACRAGRSLGPSHAAQGFHATGTLGVLGAAAAAARLLGLTPAQARAALGIAASGAAGLRLNFGTMTKPLHAGSAARAGLLAALLARRDFSAAPDALDAARGFSRVFSPADGDPAAIADFDTTWQAVTPGIAVKKYPCCNRGHRAADATLALAGRHAITPERVELIEVRMPAGEVDAAGRVGPMTYPRPQTGLEAKFSMQYVVAAAVCDRALRIGTFTDEQVRRPDVQRLLERVRPVADPRRPAGQAAANYVEVAVRLAGGQTVAERVRFSRGDPRGEPLSWDELLRKYRDCAAAALPDAQVERSAALIGGLDDLVRVAGLTAELGAPLP
jgi:2-methylcitrate dehydratase PrpD